MLSGRAGGDVCRLPPPHAGIIAPPALSLIKPPWGPNPKGLDRQGLRCSAERMGPGHTVSRGQNTGKHAGAVNDAKQHSVARRSATPAKTACSRRQAHGEIAVPMFGVQKSRRHRLGEHGFVPRLPVAAHDGEHSEQLDRLHRRRRWGGHGLPLARKLDLLDRRGLKPECMHASPAAGHSPATSLAATPAGRGRAKVEARVRRPEAPLRTGDPYRRPRTGDGKAGAGEPRLQLHPARLDIQGDLPPHDAAGREAAADRRPIDTETATRPARRHR